MLGQYASVTRTKSKSDNMLHLGKSFGYHKHDVLVLHLCSISLQSINGYAVRLAELTSTSHC